MTQSHNVLLFGDLVSTYSASLSLHPDIFTLIESSDVCCCNLEAPITSNEVSISKSGLGIRQHPKLPEWIKNSGINMLQLSNNHIFDYGLEGFNDTINNLRGIDNCGAGVFTNAYAAKEIKVNGIKIGFLSFSHHEFGLLNQHSDLKAEGVAWINHPLVNRLIIDTKKEADYLVILPHAGIELIDAPLPEWRNRYKEFIDLGADAVVGTHPHIPQGWEIYKEKPIFYSLGNFYFDAVTNPHPYWQKGIAVELTLNDKIEFKVHNLKFSEGLIEYDKDDARNVHNEYLCNLLTDEDKYMTYINQKATEHWEQYEAKIKRSLNMITFNKNPKVMARTLMNAYQGKQDLPFLLNIFRCESHRWFIMRALEQKLI